MTIAPCLRCGKPAELTTLWWWDKDVGKSAVEAISCTDPLCGLMMPDFLDDVGKLAERWNKRPKGRRRKP